MIHAGRSAKELVEEQVRRWELLRRTGTTRRLPEPVVTVSRLPGCGGRELSRALAERMGFESYDKEILHRIAEDAHLSEAVVNSLDEKVLPALDEWISWLVLHRRLTGDFIKHLTRIILSIAQHGRAVLLGRGAVFIVPPDRCLRVLVVAGRDWRIQSLARRLHLSEREARLRLLRVEEDRREFVRRHFHAEMTDPAHYDVVLNVEGLGPAGVVETARAAWEAKRKALAGAAGPVPAGAAAGR